MRSARSSLCSPRSTGAISPLRIFLQRLQEYEVLVQQPPSDSTKRRHQDGNEKVALPKHLVPDGHSTVNQGQNQVAHAGPEVSGRVDGVPGLRAEDLADGEDEETRKAGDVELAEGGPAVRDPGQAHGEQRRSQKLIDSGVEERHARSGTRAVEVHQVPILFEKNEVDADDHCTKEVAQGLGR